jgi:GT2 family glycosyltransferase
MTKVSVISVTYNNEETIELLLGSLKKNLDEKSEVIIVDNASDDKTLEKIKKYKEVKVIKNKDNLGYGRANNIAASQALGEYLFFINPDAALMKTFQKKIIKIFESDPRIGIIAPKIISGKGEQKSVRKLPTIMGAVKEYYFGQKNQYEDFVPLGKESIEVESIVGAAFIIPKKLFLEVGGFDEKYFMYFEDLDICRKIRLIGKRIIYFPDALVSHKIGYSKSEFKEKWLKESARKYHGTIKYFLLTLLLKLRPKD